MKTKINNAMKLLTCSLVIVGLVPTTLFGIAWYNYKPIADVIGLQCARALSIEAETVKLKGELEIEKIELQAERQAVPVCKNSEKKKQS